MDQTCRRLINHPQYFFFDLSSFFMHMPYILMYYSGVFFNLLFYILHSPLSLIIVRYRLKSIVAEHSGRAV
jgi:hypothetical protein